jgi:hypothetical protein
MVPRVTLKISSSKVYCAALEQYPLTGEDAAVVITGVPAIPIVIALDGALEQVPSLTTAVNVVDPEIGKVLTVGALEFPATAGDQI